MIVMIPMLCSNTVNYSAIPGIAKAMERNILINGLDFVLDLQNDKKLKQKAGKLIARESYNIISEKYHIIDENDDNHDDLININEQGIIFLQEELKDDPEGGMSEEEMREEEERLRKEEAEINKQKEKLEKEREKIEQEKQKAEEEKERVEQEKKKEEIDKKLDKTINKETEIKDRQQDIERQKKELDLKKKEVRDATTTVSMQMEGLSLEPTWMKVSREVDYKEDGERYKETVTDLLGVKILPIMVHSDEKMINLLMFDKHLNWFDSKIVSLGRKVRKKMYQKYLDAVKRIPGVRHFLGDRKSVKGDVRKDVILAKSSFRGNVLVCLNRLDLEDDFFKSTKGVNRLFKMGWNSIIAMDDSQKIAYFCLKEFKGICFPVNYQYIFTTIGKDQGKVFDDLNDLKKSSGGLFRRKIPKRKLVENVVHDHYMNDSSIRGFSNIEKFILKEDFQNKKESIGVVRGFKDFFNVLGTGDKTKIKANLERKTKYKNFSEAKRDMIKYPGFKEGYTLAKKSFKKNLKFNNIDSTRILESLAVFTGIYAVRDYVSGNMNSMKHTKKFIDKVQKRIDKNVKKITSKEKIKDPDYALGMSIFSTMCVLTAPLTLTIVYAVLSNPQMFVGLFKVFYGIIMFAIYSVYWVIFDAIVPTTQFFIGVAEKSKSVFTTIGDGIKKFQDGVEKLNNWEQQFKDFMSLDWIF